MTSMSHDPAAAVIGAQLIEMGTRAVATGAASAPAVTALAPAGAEEVSMQAAAAFEAEAAAALAAHTAAQEELARTGAALMDIARMYAQADETAAGAIVASAVEATGMTFRNAAISTTQLARGLAASAPAGLLSAEALPGAAGTAARTPLMANLIEGVAAANPSATLPAAANAASTVMSAGSAPLSSLSQLTSMGGAAGGAATGVPTSLTSEEESKRDDSDNQQANDQRTGEQLL
jgi:PE family